MRLSYMVWREISRRRASFLAGVTAATVAAGTLAGSLAAIRAHDARTTRLLDSQREDLRGRLAALDNDIERAMSHLGYAFTIVAADQDLSDWYATDYASAFLAQASLDQLASEASSERITFLPRIRHKVKWPERDWTVLLVGQGNPLGNDIPPSSPDVAPDHCVLGHEIHTSLNLETGQTIRFMGASFTIGSCLPETGSKDDVTVTMPLPDAQRLLGKTNLISEILVHQPHPTIKSVAWLQQVVALRVPGSRLVGNASYLTASMAARRDVARDGEMAIAAERDHQDTMRHRRTRLLTLISMASLLVAVAWLFLLAHTNVRQRSEEIGILRTLGYSTRQVLWLLLCRGLITGILGGTAGALTGAVTQAVASGHGAAGRSITLFAFTVAILATMAGGSIPAWQGAQMDPAERLRGTS